MEPKIIGITGGTGSGKSTIVRRIREAFPDSVFMAQDSYYQSVSTFNNNTITSFNFDQPSAFDNQLLYRHLSDLKQGKPIEMPQYDFVHSVRTKETVHVEPKPVIVIEGLMVLYDQHIRDLLDLKLYVDTPADIRFIRRLKRDINERGRTMDSVITQYLEVVRPGHEHFIEPTKQYADLIIPEGGNNYRALSVLLSFIRSLGVSETGHMRP